MRHCHLSHRRKQSLAPALRQLSGWLITGDYYFPCYVDAVKRSWSVLSRAQAWAGDVENNLLPMQHTPSLNSADGCKGKAEPVRLDISCVAGIARGTLQATPVCLRDSGS